jgi:hypothetical protein
LGFGDVCKRGRKEDVSAAMEVMFVLNVVLKFSLNSFNESDFGDGERMRAMPALFINTIYSFLSISFWEKGNGKGGGNKPSNLPYFSSTYFFALSIVSSFVISNSTQSNGEVIPIFLSSEIAVWAEARERVARMYVAVGRRGERARMVEKPRPLFEPVIRIVCVLAILENGGLYVTLEELEGEK